MGSSKILSYQGIGQVEFKKRHHQKSIRINVKSHNVIVSLPYYTPYIVAIKFFESKYDWVKSHHKPKIELKSGMHIGKSMRLEIVNKPNNYSRIENGSIICSGSDDHIYKTIIKALKIQSETLITRRLEEICNNHKLQYSKVNYRNLKSRWGSCNQNKELTFNLLLVQLNWRHIDYVIYHELCHTIEMNHSKEFWNLVENYLPNYKQTRKELKKIHPQIIDTSDQY